MMLLDAILLLAIAMVFWLFWQGRRQAEHARRYAQRYCQQHQLQFLDIAWRNGKLAKKGRHFGWLSNYDFAFSSDQQTRYEGELQLLNLRLVNITTPPYRVPDA